MSKPSLTICLQNKIGGVQFFYANLVRTGAFGDFDLRYLATDKIGDRDTKLMVPLEGAPSHVIEYGREESVHGPIRRFARSLPTEPGIVLTNFDIELRCLDARRRPDLTIVHFCHDEDYIEIAVRYAHVIDTFVAHNPHFVERLKSELPVGRAGDVHFLPFGIFQNESVCRVVNPDRPLRVAFIGRLHRKKGALELPAIDDRLRELGVTVEWSILGSGPDQEVLEREIAGRPNFTISSPPDAAAMLAQASRGDVFVLPSRLDGTPLAVMEAMSVGLVPIVSNFNPGASWMVPPEVGFIHPVEPAAFAEQIAHLHGNRAELETRSRAALERARQEFDVRKKAMAYAEFFSGWRQLKRRSSASSVRYQDRLDQAWMPNPLVMFLRKVRSRMRRLREKFVAARQA